MNKTSPVSSTDNNSTLQYTPRIIERNEEKKETLETIRDFHTNARKFACQHWDACAALEVLQGSSTNLKCNRANTLFSRLLSALKQAYLRTFISNQHPKIQGSTRYLLIIMSGSSSASNRRMNSDLFSRPLFKESCWCWHLCGCQV